MKYMDINSLPDDSIRLKALLLEQAEQLISKDQQLSNKDKQLINKDQQLSAVETEVRFLREQVNLLLHKRFAASSEQYRYPGQHELFDEAEATVDVVVEEETTIDDAAVTVAGHARKKPGRKPLPAELPRIDVMLDLDEQDKVCSVDGHALHKIGEEITEKLDIIPAKMRVIRTIRPKYGCRHCETGITTAEVPPQIIPRGIATPGLLAHVVVSKYADALPLYRQEKIFERLGIELHRATLANWMIKVDTALTPLITLLREELIKGRVIHMDETPVQVLKEPGKTPQSQSYMWVSMSGAYDPAIVLYDYDPSRASSVPARLLPGYDGYLVSDGYSAYHTVTTQSAMTGVGCWAHVRRKFDEALKVQGKTKTGKAQVALNEIRKLYAIERQIQEKPPDEKRKVRQSRASPIIEQFRRWLDKSINQVPPKTTLGKALRYADNEWPRLIRYLEDGELPIDNNRCENAIRPFVVGRKNWLFANSQQGVRASAAIYSLVESAKHNGLDPYQYLRYVFTELPKIEAHELHELLPYNTTMGLYPFLE
jgi:transposase